MNKVKKKILIVDDNDIVRETYAQVLVQKGFEVLQAADGLEGLDMATKLIPDLILTGIIMPRMDGFMLIKSLRENISTSSIPVAIISHLGREEDRRKATELGIKHFFVQGQVTPLNVAVKLEEILDSSSYYKMPFQLTSEEIKNLGDELGVPDLLCPECQTKLELRMRVNEGSLESDFYCPNCKKLLQIK